jgi:hypothetical protein
MNNYFLLYTILLNPLADTEIDFKAKYSLKFTGIINSSNVSDLAIYINNSLVSSGLTIENPIFVNANDNIKLEVSRDYTQLSRLELIGNSI